MKIFYTFLLVIVNFLLLNAQVGINTSNPKSTLEIVGKSSDINSKDGIIVPKLTGAELKAKTYGTDQNSALVYVTTPLTGTDLANQVINVNSIGFYYFDSSSNFWKPIDTNTDTGNIYSTDGTLAANRAVHQNGKTLTFTDNNARSTTTTVDNIIFGQNENLTTDSNPSLVINSGARKIAINKKSPRVTLDINGAFSSITDAPEGILIPKMTKSELSKKLVTTYQGRSTSPSPNNTGQASMEGTLVYIYPDTTGQIENGATTDPSYAKVANVIKEGLYFYGMDDKWHPVGETNNFTGDVTNDAWINDTTNTMVNLATTSSGGTRTTGQNVSVTDNGRLNLGFTATPDAGINLVGDNDAAKDDIRIDSYGAAASPSANLRMYSLRGSQAAPTNLALSDNLGQFNFYGRIAGTNQGLAKIWSDYQGNGTTLLSNLKFSVNGLTNTSMIIDNNENVGIGTHTPNANAKLEISASNKGLLLPRVTLTATNNVSPLTAHVAGMEVYNTATNTTSNGNEVFPGRYINDGTQWIRQMTVNDRRIIAGANSADNIPTPIAVAVGTTTDGVVDLFATTFTLDKPSYVDFRGNISTSFTDSAGSPIVDGRTRLAIAYWTFTATPPPTYVVGGQYARATVNFSNYYNGNAATSTHTNGNFFLNPSATYLLPIGTYSVKLTTLTVSMGVNYTVTWGPSSYDTYSITATSAK